MQTVISSPVGPLVQPPIVLRFEAPAPDETQAPQPPSKFILYRPGMDYGVGVDTPSGSAVGAAVTGSPTPIPGVDEFS